MKAFFVQAVAAAVFLAPAAASAVTVQYVATSSPAPARAPTGVSVGAGDVTGDGRGTATASPTAGSVAAPTASPQEAQFDYYLKVDGVDGETKPTPTPQEGAVPGIEPDDIDNSAEQEAKESGEKGGTEDINIGVGELQTNFGVLLGGGSGGISPPSEEALRAVADILKQGAEESGRPMEQISMNYEKIQVKYSKMVQLLGFIPVPAKVDVEIPLEGEGEVKVKFPWWAALAFGGKDDAVEEAVDSLSDALKTKHDTVKNAIGNIR